MTKQEHCPDQAKVSDCAECMGVLNPTDLPSLETILVDFFNDISGTVDGLIVEAHQLEIGRAQAQIAKAIEVIIGPDDDTTGGAFPSEKHRNKLRAEQRERFQAFLKGGQNEDANR